MAMARSIGGLPVEINNQILQYLDLRSLTHLRACNWYYRSLSATMDKWMPVLLMELEMSSARANPKHLFVNGYLPCYTCLKMQPRALFCTDFLQHRYRAAGQGSAILRVCQQCRPGHDDSHIRRSAGSKKRCHCAKKVEMIRTGPELMTPSYYFLPFS